MHAAVIATTVTDGSSRAYTLTVDGADVLGAFAGAPYMVPTESITVTEAAPGDVSDMRFSIWDPSLLVTVPEMGVVEFWDVTNNLPIFRGFVEEYSYEPTGVGRTINISCLGVERVLDWMILTSDVTFASGIAGDDAAQALAAQATGVGVQLRAFSGTADNGTQANPVGDLGGASTPQSVTVTAGTSLREGLRQVLAAGNPGIAGPNTIAEKVMVTVDFWSGLRVFYASSAPNDWASLTIDDATGAANATTHLEHATDGGARPRQVYIKGGNATGSGLVGDGSGLPGSVDVVEDATSTTAAIRDNLAANYLAQFTTSVRGSLIRESWSPTTNIRPNSALTVSNTQAGVGAVFRIATITKTFYATVQTWTITYGAPKRDAMRTIGRKLRTLRS